MKIECLQHVPFEGPAYFEKIAEKIGAELSVTHLYRGDALPAPASFDLLLVMGGPMGVHDEERYPWLIEEKRFLDSAIGENKPVLGICLGAQLIAHVMGADVRRNREVEIGWYPVERRGDAVFTSIGRVLPETFFAFHWHGDTFDIPAGAYCIARSDACDNQAFVYDDRVVGLQFHLESTGESVAALLKNCADELVNAPHVQDRMGILDTSHIVRSNGLMERVVEKMINASVT